MAVQFGAGIAYSQINGKYHRGRFGPFEGVIIDTETGFINATALCKQAKTAGGKPKELTEWRRSREANIVMDYLTRSMEIARDQLLVDVANVPNELKGTYAHPRLIIHIAQWCSVEFADAVTDIVQTYYVQQATAAKDRQLAEQNRVLGEKDDAIAILNRKIDELLGYAVDTKKQNATLLTDRRCPLRAHCVPLTLCSIQFFESLEEEGIHAMISDLVSLIRELPGYELSLVLSRLTPYKRALLMKAPIDDKTFKDKMAGHFIPDTLALDGLRLTVSKLVPNNRHKIASVMDAIIACRADDMTVASSASEGLRMIDSLNMDSAVLRDIFSVVSADTMVKMVTRTFACRCLTMMHCAGRDDLLAPLCMAFAPCASARTLLCKTFITDSKVKIERIPPASLLPLVEMCVDDADGFTVEYPRVFLAAMIAVSDPDSLRRWTSYKREEMVLHYAIHAAVTRSCPGALLRLLAIANDDRS